MTRATQPAAEAAGTFIPLNKLKVSPRNTRRTPHGAAAIEALAASIGHKGLLQNLVVEPERDAEGGETGFFLVTAGEGRRQALMLRAKRKEIKKTEPVRCVIDTGNDPQEISLDENVSRTQLSPADEFEAFHRLSVEKGWSAAEIAARFGVKPGLVRQRLKLASVSPKLIQVYRDGGLTLEQLAAFTLSDDHARQEQVHASLGWNKDPAYIRRTLTAGHVQPQDRRVALVGLEAYERAGGEVLRDLFTGNDDVWLTDIGLLDRLTLDCLEAVAAEIRAEGWKWVEASIVYPHGLGLSRFYPEPVELTPADQMALDAAETEYDRIVDTHAGYDDPPEDIRRRLDELDAEIESIKERETAYDPGMVARGGAFVTLNHDGTPRIDRGFIRPEDKAAEPEAEADPEDEKAIPEDDEAVDGDGGFEEDGDGPANAENGDDAEDDGASPSLSPSLVRDLTAHRTVGLRLALGEQPDVALTALVHALASQAFYSHYSEASCVGIRLDVKQIESYAPEIPETAVARTLQDRHDAWAARLPTSRDDLWPAIAGMTRDDRLTLLAHCAGMAVFAVSDPWGNNKPAIRHADDLAGALTLNMAAHWSPTVTSYLGRITKAGILATVTEVCGEDAAERLQGLKKQPMAKAAEEMLAGSGWLPALLRTWPAEPGQAGNDNAGDAGDVDLEEPASSKAEVWPEAAE